MDKRKNSFKKDSPALTSLGKITATHPGITPERAPDNTHPISKKQGIVEAVSKNKSTNYSGSFGSMRLGTVNFFNEESGYGFIRDIMTRESFFVYRSCLKESVVARDRVSFEIKKTPGGFIAANVRKVIPPFKK